MPGPACKTVIQTWVDVRSGESADCLHSPFFHVIVHCTRLHTAALSTYASCWDGVRFRERFGQVLLPSCDDCGV